MNQKQPTLGELRHKLAVRLGFATSGDIVLRQLPILEDFLQEAQDWLYWNIEDERWFVTARIQPGLGQSLLDLPADLETRKPLSFWVRDRVEGSACWSWQRLTRGHLFNAHIEEHSLDAHTPFMRSTDNSLGGYPCSYRFVGRQFEVAPATPTQTAEIRIDYTRALPRFVQEQDRLLVDERPVLLYALAQAKAHYQHPDAGQYGGLLEKYLGKLRAGSHTDERYIPGRRVAKMPGR